MLFRMIRNVTHISITLLLISVVLQSCVSTQESEVKPPRSVRIALFNIWEMSTEKIMTTDSNGVGQNEQLVAAVEILKRVAPDVLVINEIDHDLEAVDQGADLSLNLTRFQKAYLGGEIFKYSYIAPCNTGRLAGKDFDRNGMIATESDAGSRDQGGDCYGYGSYPGQYSMAILSKYPLDEEQARTFQKFLWKDLPNNMIPRDWYSEDQIEVFRLSSKSHWDVPLVLDDKTIHLLVSHPTPPSFDGPEDRNGKRNYDEIKMWVHYIDGDTILVDDEGTRGGLTSGASFIVMGDLNAGPGGDTLASGQRAIDQLLDHPMIQDSAELLQSEGPLNGRAPGPPRYIENWTSGRGGKWGRRIDHMLPSNDLKVVDGGVFWPDAGKDSVGAALAQKASDHRLIWLDIEL